MSQKKKLLLVDDDEAVLDYLAVKLGREFDLVSTQSAAEALALAAEAKPDLILCDIELPGMDGGDISAKLFADVHTRDIPLVFLTALMTPADLKARGNQLAGRAAVSKQSPIEEITARIRAALH